MKKAGDLRCAEALKAAGNLWCAEALKAAENILMCGSAEGNDKYLQYGCRHRKAMGAAVSILQHRKEHGRDETDNPDTLL